jgi:ribonuclease HI
MEERIFTNKQITENIKRRCNNMKDNLTNMLSSILEQPYRRIDLNKILITLPDGSQHISSDPNTVKSHTKVHFSNISNTTNNLPPDSLWNEWAHIYQPLNYIKPEWYNYILSPITKTELLNNISNLPLKKGAGPSTISNEMLKHLNPDTIEILLSLFNRCISTSHIPSAWKQANVYPIPKPKEWHYQLTHTRPITLLECTRKCFYKIITNRLSSTMLTYSILKGNNFAGLPGKSCQEPIHIINAISENARESKKECWILSQDMSKAFDLINRNMLDKAMIRLQFPQQLRTLLLTAFQDRTNQVITDYGLTDPYQLNNGIDQGEVFSPLMWCIYYDPLLCHIQSKTELGYTISTTLPSNLTTNPYTTNTESITVTNVAYMDDTTWIAPSKENMNEILSIASSFYQLNGIKINPDKSTLMVINSSKNNNNDTYATFNNIPIHPTATHTPVRILGVWFNASGSRKHHISSFKNTINTFKSLLYPKKLTGEQIKYIINHVLAPRLEYRYQTTFFSKKECSQLLSPIKKLFKNKLGLSRSFPNSAIHHPHFYNLFDYWQLQCQSMITNFIVRINDPSLIGEITYIQLKQLQSTLWIPFCPLLITQVLPMKLNYKNITAACITLMISSNLSCQPSSPFISSFNIKGGKNPLINIIPDQYFKITSSLKKHSILFLEQLLSCDCSTLLPTNMLFHRLPFSKFRKPPKWYNTLKSQLCDSQNNHLNPIPDLPHINPFIFPSLYIPSNDMRHKPIVASMTNSNLIIAKRISSTLYRHYTLNENTNTVSPCTGCQKSIYSPNAPCTIANINNQIYLACKRLSSSTYKLKIKISDVIYLIQNINNTQPIAVNNNISLDTSNSTNSQLIQSIFTSFPLQNILSSHTINNQSAQSLIFYTDGSISKFGQQDIKLSCAWIQIKDGNIQQSFSCSLTSFPSSTRAELMAIMTALITCPQHCSVSIYTDSQSSIQLLNNNPILNTTRNKFKIKNYSIISSIHHIKKSLSLKISFHKIKSHSGNKYNDLVDSLAKSALPEILQINPSSIKFHTPIIFNQQYVDYPLRSFIKINSNSQAIIKWRTQPILAKQIPSNIPINWSYTEFCLKFSHYSMFTENNSHFYHGSLFSFKLEILHNTLPTIKNLIRNYPTLLPPNLNCLYCNQTPENTTHLFSCQANSNLDSIPWPTIQQSIFSQISNWYTSSKLTQTKQSLQPLFQSNFNHIPPVLLAAGVAPLTLINFLYPIFSSHKKTSTILHIISYNLINFYYKNIWLPRCALLNSWLKLNNINLKNKTANQLYSPNPTTQTSSRSLHESNNSHINLINNFINTGSDFLLPR